MLRAVQLNLTRSLLSALGQAGCLRVSASRPARCPRTALPHGANSRYLRVLALCQDGHRGAPGATQLPQLPLTRAIAELSSWGSPGHRWGWMRPQTSQPAVSLEGLSHGGMWWSGRSSCDRKFLLITSRLVVDLCSPRQKPQRGLGAPAPWGTRREQSPSRITGALVPGHGNILGWPLAQRPCLDCHTDCRTFLWFHGKNGKMWN